MGFHFDANTTVDRVPIREIIRALKDAKEFRPISDPAARLVCINKDLVRTDPYDENASLLTDLGNRVRTASFGERVPLQDAKTRFDAFMLRVCRAFETDKTLPVRDADPLVEGWLFGSFMREEPTVGDIDLVLPLPNGFRPDPFISLAEDHLDLINMPIPCRPLRVSLREGRAEWGFAGEIGYHPANTSHLYEDPSEPVTLMTDKGLYRSGTPSLDDVIATLEEAAEALRSEDVLPLPLAATVRRDIIARYTGGANGDESPAHLIDLIGNFRRNEEGARLFRDGLEKVMENLLPSPEMCP